MRIVLTVVGLSLLENVLEKGPLNLAKQVGALANGNRRAMQLEIENLRQHIEDIKAGALESPEQYADLEWLRQREPAVGYLAEILRAVWQSDRDDRFKQAHSPAELASLSLLDPRLGSGDEVWLLYSQTPTAALCSAILAAVLEEPGVGSTLCDADIKVSQEMLEGVQIDEPHRLAEQGLESWALALERAQETARLADTQVLLNITGGYKGVAPLGALLAFGLSERGKPIRTFYLYEESDELLFLPGTELLRFDLEVFKRYKQEWKKLPAKGLPWPDEKNILTTDFKENVVEQRSDLFDVGDDRLQLTVTGRLLLAVWKARQHVQREPPPQPGV